MISEVSMINHQNVARERKNINLKEFRRLLKRKIKKQAVRTSLLPVTRDKNNPKLR